MAITIDVFNKKLVEYYGEHTNEYVKKITIQYVQKTYNSKYLGLLLTAIMKNHPYKYGYPDVSAIEKSHTVQVRDGGKVLKNQLSDEEWHTNIAPLTEQEKQDAVKPREEWEAFHKKIGLKVQDIRCETCIYFVDGKKTYECRGCISLSNHKKRESNA